MWSFKGPNTQDTNQFGLQLQLQSQSAGDNDETIDDRIGRLGFSFSPWKGLLRSLLNGMDSLLGPVSCWVGGRWPALGPSWGKGLGRFWVVEVNKTT